MTDRLAALSAAGVSIWLDDLTRERLTSGGLERLVAEDHVVGVTTNPTIFDKAISEGAGYADQIAVLAERGLAVEDVVHTLTTDDVRTACDVMAPVYDATGGVDGRVSLEVDPGLAADTAATVAEAKSLHALVDRPQLYVKIPATLAGLPAITATLAEGISVNVTLIFGIERYRGVMDAWLSGLEQAKQAGQDLASIHSVASFFVSRVDTEVDRRLPADSPLRGRAAIANARLAHAAYAEMSAGARWAALAAEGAHTQRPLWASTGTKDKAYSDTRYVDQLIARGVVNTMPEATMRAVADHGDIAGDTVSSHYDEARATFADLAAAGIDMDDVVRVLEVEGVQKFVDSWDALRATVETALAKHRGGSAR